MAHKDEFYYQNPPDLGENLFAWLPLGNAQNSVNVLMKKKKPDVSGEDAAGYWYKSRVNYDYDKDPKDLHTQNSGKMSYPKLFYYKYKLHLANPCPLIIPYF